jgi:hypothetical protein
MKEVEKNEQKNDVSDMHEVQETKQRELAATQNKERYGNSLESMSSDGKTREDFCGKLNEFDTKNLKNETGWSDEIVDQIDNKKQAEIYKNADLHQENINGKECLVKDIDYDYVDEKTGMTNRELMAKGRSPYDAKTGEWIVENHGVDPDILLDNDPIKEQMGQDEQLEKAIQVVLEQLKERKPLPTTPKPRTMKDLGW